MVLTLILLMQRQRKHPHKLSGYIFKERSPEIGADQQVYSASEAADQPCGQRRIVLEICRGSPFPQQAAHYTGPGVPVNTFLRFFCGPRKALSDGAFGQVKIPVFSREKRAFRAAAAGPPQTTKTSARSYPEGPGQCSPRNPADSLRPHRGPRASPCTPACR